MSSVAELPGGHYHLGDLMVARVGYGAMQLAGPGVFGPPAVPRRPAHRDRGRCPA
jgi:pyridoxine 4-dehydrogenase